MTQKPIKATLYCPCAICSAERESVKAVEHLDVTGIIQHDEAAANLAQIFQHLRLFAAHNPPEKIRASQEQAERYGDVMFVATLDRYLDAVNAARTFMETADRMKANALAAYLDQHPEAKEESK